MVGSWCQLHSFNQSINDCIIWLSQLNFEGYAVQGTGRKSLKMSHSDLRRFNAIPDLSSRIFPYTLVAFDRFFSYCNLIIYPPAILPCSQNWEEAHWKWLVLIPREVDDGARAMLRFLSKAESFPFFWCWCVGSNGSKKDSTRTKKTLKQLNLKLMNKSFVFVRERECQ